MIVFYSSAVIIVLAILIIFRLIYLKINKTLTDYDLNILMLSKTPVPFNDFVFENEEGDIVTCTLLSIDYDSDLIKVNDGHLFNIHNIKDIKIYNS
jgi:hypothetical protein